MHPRKLSVGDYSCSKKKVAWLAIKLPAKFCDAYIRQVMMVRLKSVPLRRSRRLGSSPILASISTVRSIMASVSWGFSVDLRPRRWIERRPGPLVVSLVVAVGSASNNDTADRPTHLQSTCQGVSERERNNFASVGGRVRNEDSPRNALKRLSNRENSE